MKKVLVLCITFYQKVLSLDSGFLPRIFGASRPTCIYYPRCSEYMKEAVLVHGLIKGVGLGIARVGRCTPLHEPGVDLVPKVR
jgi:putative membrane protein insertion efficiency factor